MRFEELRAGESWLMGWLDRQAGHRWPIQSASAGRVGQGGDAGSEWEGNQQYATGDTRSPKQPGAARAGAAQMH
jgi:hypothetical protein